MLNKGKWFTEVHEDAGSAFSLRITERLHRERTPYQEIEIYRTTDFGNLMVIDGYVMLSSRDNFLYHEMMTHPVLYTHPRPRRVCIIGGGDCGTLREVLRHTEVEQVVQIDIDERVTRLSGHTEVEQVVQIDIDERVTRLSERYFPELCDANADPRAQLLFADGIRWMREAPPGALDVIIVDSTDPVGPAEGLFTRDFHRDCLNALAPGGLLVQQSESPLYHMGILRSMYAAMEAAGFADRRTLFFPQCVYPSGWWSATLARKGAAIDGFRSEDAERRTFPTRYYNCDIHQAALAVPEFFKVEMQVSGSVV